MGKFAHSADRHASILEATIPGMIKKALIDTMTPLSLSINALATWIAVCKQGLGATEEVMALKAATAELRRDMDQLMSTYMSMIFRTVEFPDMLVDLDMPLSTTGDKLSVDEEDSFEGLIEVEEAIIDSIVHISLSDTTMAGLSVTDTSSTNAQDQSVASGTDALTDGAIT
ncbi:hypothetical protein H5410_046373 [Solanum commersonii]|uniref:Polyprotein protein n=1 Tax=Solanum commersonii TaxID=4109 RepID=A0A9J5XC34_SOLCO|nr:hypothetical protein H5410_046373 [Solanum commersonii]